MKIKTAVRYGWGLLWKSKNKLDGENQHIIWDAGTPIIFYTKAAAQSWAKEHCGYIASRKDLRNEPHGWRLPKAIRIIMKVFPERTA